MFPIDSYSEHLNSQAGPLNSPCAPNWIKLVEVYSVMLHTKYQGTVHCRFRQEDLFYVRGQNPEIDTIKYHNWPETPNGKVTKHKKIPQARKPRDQPFPSRWSHAYVKYATSRTVPFKPQGYNWRSTRLCYMPNIKILGIVVSKKKIFILKIYFSPCDLDLQWTKLFEQLFKRVL